LKDRIYTDLGSDDGIKEGSELTVVTGGKPLTKATVIELGRNSSVARFGVNARLPRPHDQVVAVITPPVAPAAEPPALAAPIAPAVDAFARATQQGYPMVSYATTSSVAKSYRGRAEAHLRNQAWWSADAGSAATFTRTFLDLYLSGPLDQAGDWQAELDMSAAAQEHAPTTHRTHQRTGAWLEVYRATLSYHGLGSIALGLGRDSDPALRYGQVDGAFFTWNPDRAFNVRMSGGSRPDLVSFKPTAEAPTLLLAISGDAGDQAVWASYNAAAMWLSMPSENTQASEASLATRLDLWRVVTLTVDVAGVMAQDSAGHSTSLVDRISVGTTLRLGSRASLQVAARRLQEPGLAMDLALLPSSYLGASTTQDAYAHADAVLLDGETFTLDSSMGGGVIRETGQTPQAWWLSPGVAWRIKGPWGLHGRLAYHGEDGPIAAHLGELGVGVTPAERVRVDITAQGGVLITLDHHQLLLTERTWLRVAYGIGERLDLGFSGQVAVGELGTHATGLLAITGYDLF